MQSIIKAAQKQKNGESNMEKMEISQEGLALIKRFEGCSLTSYLCQANVPTIGYGSTRGVEMGMEISQERADALLLEDVADFEEAVNECVKVPLTQNQFDSIVAWCFNIGKNAMRNSTLLKVLNNSEYQKVPSEMKRWNKVTVNGEKVVSDGLMRRREAESLLFKDEPWHEV